MAGEWKSVPLGELCDEERGITYRIVKVGEIIPGGPVLRGGDIRAGRIMCDDSKRVSEDVSNQFRRTILRGGEIVLNLIADPGHSAIVPPELAGHNVSRDVAVIPLNGNPDRRFMDFFLKSKIAVDWLTARLQGSVTQKINLGTFRELPVPQPPLSEQIAIAAVLGALDDKIGLNRRMNATLEAMARALSQSWFEDFDPVRAKLDGQEPVGVDPVIAALFPDSFQDSEVGHIPKGWTVRPLNSHACYLSCGIGPSYLEQGGVCVLNQKCVRDHRVDCSKSRRHDSAKKPINGRVLQIFDVLVNSTVMGTLGRVAHVFHLPEETIVDSHVTIVRAAADTDALFLGINLTRREAEIEELVEGSTGQTELSRARLGELKIIAPPHDLQKAFGVTVRPLLVRMSENESQSLTLATLRGTLLPKLLSGELSVAEVNKSSR